MKFPKKEGKGVWSVFPRMGEKACDLLEKMLAINPSERITAQEIVDHPFFKEKPKERNPNRRQPRAPTRQAYAAGVTQSPGSVGSDSEPEQ